MRITDAKKLDSMFLERWSPRSFESTAILPEDIEALFEAARWAPSCFNEQPWHFVYATKGEGLEKLQAVLVEGNQVWAKQAPMLVIVFARKQFGHNQKSNTWAAFDTGAATMSLNLQAHALGLSCHLMGGFIPEKAYAACEVNPETHLALCALAVGKKGPKGNLSSELEAKEEPSDRHPTQAFLKKL